MAGTHVTFEDEVLYVANTHIVRNEDDTCTAVCTIKGREVEVTYKGKEFLLPENTERSGKPWLHDVRLDLCREFIRQYGHNAVTIRKVNGKPYTGLLVDFDFITRLHDKLGIDFRSINTGSYQLMVGQFEITKAKLGKTRKVDLCRRLREQMPLIKRVQRETAEVEDFFAEFSIA